MNVEIKRAISDVEIALSEARDGLEDCQPDTLEWSYYRGLVDAYCEMYTLVMDLDIER